MNEWLTIDNHFLWHGDCLDALRALPDSFIDAVVTDPPYGLSFMGKKWDYDVPSVEVWAECLRVLKPGGHLLAFAGTRTQHRMAVRIEDAGFEIRDMIAWVYGSGFPKSLDVSKAIDKAAGAERTEVIGKSNRCIGPSQAGDNGIGTFKEKNWAASNLITAPATPEAQQWAGWGTALKPALEPITVARKPLVGTVAANVLQHGTGALNIDGCRVEATGESRERKGEASREQRYAESGSTDFAATPGVRGGDPAGRWPANLIHDGSDEVTELFPTTGKSSGGGRSNGDKFGGGYAPPGADSIGFGDTGSAARFFYCAKTSAAERAGSKHPTVKPLALMRYLVRLVTPPGGVVLDPFIGSGTTMLACEAEGFRCVGAERESVEDIKQRWAKLKL
jgi:hypothetical protein